MPTEITTALIAGIVGLVTGAIGSLIAPWVNWGIEKQRERLKYRREIVQRCRELLGREDFSKQTARSTVEYRYLRPHLSPDDVKVIESNGILIAQGEPGVDPQNAYRRMLAAAIDKLERHWGLV